MNYNKRDYNQLNQNHNYTHETCHVTHDLQYPQRPGDKQLRDCQGVFHNQRLGFGLAAEFASCEGHGIQLRHVRLVTTWPVLA